MDDYGRRISLTRLSTTSTTSTYKYIYTQTHSHTHSQSSNHSWSLLSYALEKHRSRGHCGANVYLTDCQSIHRWIFNVRVITELPVFDAFFMHKATNIDCCWSSFEINAIHHNIIPNIISTALMLSYWPACIYMYLTSVILITTACRVFIISSSLRNVIIVILLFSWGMEGEIFSF